MSTTKTVEQTAILPSILTRKQVKTFRKDFIDEFGNPVVIIAKARHDDECNNGHNSFAIKAEIYLKYRQPGESTVKHENGKTLWLNSCGCQPDEVREHFPQLAPFIRWHLSSTDGPMHYLANALYHAGHTKFKDAANLDHLKSTIVYGALREDETFDLADHMHSDARGFTHNEAKMHELTDWLDGRLHRMLWQFKRDVESLGFTY